MLTLQNNVGVNAGMYLSSQCCVLIPKMYHAGFTPATKKLASRAMARNCQVCSQQTKAGQESVNQPWSPAGAAHAQSKHMGNCETHQPLPHGESGECAKQGTTRWNTNSGSEAAPGFKCTTDQDGETELGTNDRRYDTPERWETIGINGSKSGIPIEGRTKQSGRVELRGHHVREGET